MSRYRKQDPHPDAPRGEEEVRRLLRDAGRRPAPPEEDLAAIRTAARGAWQELVEERQRQQRRRFRMPVRRALPLAAGLALAVLAAFWWLRSESQPIVADVVASVEHSSGAVLMGEEPVTAASRIPAGAELSTGHADGSSAGRAALRMTGGQSVRLDQGTAVRLLSAGRVELLRGAVYVDSPPSGEVDGHVDVVTELGTVVEIGTQFEVRLDPAAGVLDVRVREGAVSLRRGDLSVAARRGEGLTVRRDGSLSRHNVAVGAAAWGWVLDAAPALAIDGRSLAEVLEWIARETGWELVYASEELERSAPSIRVHSSVRGLRPDEVHEAVVPSSGLEWELEAGTLTVSRP